MSVAQSTHIDAPDVGTEFVPDRPITDEASRAFDGTRAFPFQPGGLRTEVHRAAAPAVVPGAGSARRAGDRFHAPRHERALAKMTAILAVAPDPSTTG